jgi:hypothetical protein
MGRSLTVPRIVNADEEERMRNPAIAVMAAACFGLAACDVDQTQEGELPDVDVNATGGEMPEYNVEGPEVNVGTENVTTEVPTVDVDVPEENEQ